jgi:hypothetical protein
MSPPILLFAAVLIVSLPKIAFATPNFPSAIEQDLGLGYSPACALCHTDGNAGGLGTVNTPFGTNMRAYGLIAYDTASLSSALSEMASNNVDSVGDCVSDITKLKEDKDPNTADTGMTCAPTVVATSGGPSYGCNIGLAHSSGEGWEPFGVVAAVLARLRGRRRAIRQARVR